MQTNVVSGGTWVPKNEPRECVHLGELLDKRMRAGCGMDGMVASVYSCGVFGEAAIFKVLTKDKSRPDINVACCIGCQQFKRSIKD